MPSPEVAERTITVSDGVTIAIHDSGGAGRPLVLANGLGGPFKSWRHQIDYLSDRYRLVSWDYRGLYGSTAPGGDSPRLGVDAHVEDLERVLEAVGVSRAAFMGWSMGVQVILELYERRPELVSHLILVNGTFGRPLDSTGVPLSSRIVPGLVDQVHRVHEIASGLLRRATQWPETVMWLKRLGVVGNTMDEELFREIAAEFGSVNLDTYLAILRELGNHDAAHVLDSIAVPTLIISGDRDAFTPRQLAQQMARRIRGGEILVVRGATHYAAMEYPELVNLRIEKFLREHGY